MVCAFMAIALSNPADIVIAENGVTDWAIVVEETLPGLQHGAKELQTFLKEISGAELSIVNKRDRGRKAIVVRSDRKLREEEYVIRTDANGITISGGGLRGAMYGCYGLLQDVLGCRWFTSTISRIPRRRRLAVPSLDIREKPAFEYREPFFTEAFETHWAVRNRTNGNAQRIDESMGGKISYGRFVHTFYEIVSPEVYFKDHPEYFSFVDGRRQDGYKQLCLTNPDVLRITIAKVEEWIRDNPTATIFSVSQNDTYSYCQCDACKKIETEEESPSGPLLRFVNQVADAIGKKHPNVLIDTLAYQWSEKPPKIERPHKNVRVRLAPIYACFAHPLNGCEQNRTALANLKAWSKITNQLYIWHYCTDFAHYLQPLPCLDEIAGDIKLFKESGVVGVFDEGAYPPGGCGDMAELKSYLLARLMWNPNLDANAIITEFLNGVYGDAAPMIQEWLDLTHLAAREKNIHATIYDPPTAAYFSQEMLERGRQLFDEAELKTLTDAQAHEMVRKARMGLQYLEFMRTAEGDPKRAARAKELADAIRHFGVQQVSEGGSAAEFLKRIGQ